MIFSSRGRSNVFVHRNKILYSYGYYIWLYNFFPEKNQVRNCQRQVESRDESKKNFGTVENFLSFLWIQTLLGIFLKAKKLGLIEFGSTPFCLVLEESIIYILDVFEIFFCSFEIRGSPMRVGGGGSVLRSNPQTSNASGAL